MQEHNTSKSELNNMASKRPLSPELSSDQAIYKSSPISHGQCIFRGAYSPTASTSTLQGLPDFRTATHRMAAWRHPSKQKSLMPASKVLYDTGHDDDGEKWAGTRLRNVLNDCQVEGTVVVARWYGGQNIGPIRFTHIENCAKEAIWKWKTAQKEEVQEQSVKKVKREEDEKKDKLVRELRERDDNILTLRKLLAEKKARLEDEEVIPPTPSKAQDYGKMNLMALERIDKARDKTVAFILGQIEKIEEELKLVEALEGDLDDVAASKGGNAEDTKDKEKVERPSTPTRDGR